MSRKILFDQFVHENYNLPTQVGALLDIGDTMQPKHVIIAVLIAVVWGSNFVFIQLGIAEIPPITLCVIRFFLASIPLVFFIKRPNVKWRLLLLYSFLTFALQFSFLFLGMKAGVSSGLASLLGQMQVFFSFLLAAVFLGESLTRFQLAGTFIAFIGVFVVLEHLGGGDITLQGFLWILLASIAWGAGNLCIKKMNQKQGIGLIVWSSALACPPLFLASYFIDGPTALFTALHTLSWHATLAVFYIAYASTWFGYGLWAWLLSIYPVNTVVPFTLLVPVFGFAASALVFGEVMQQWKIIAAILIVFGLVVNLFGARLPRLFKFYQRRGEQNV